MESVRLGTRKKIFNGLGWVLIVTAFALLVGIVVCLIMLGIGNAEGQNEVLLYILAGSFLAGAVVLGCLGYLCTRYTEKLEKRRLDAWEREDGENSFSVGEGTLATFRGALVIHREKGEKGARSVRIPYAEIRAYSVCLRRRAEEKGEWCVVFEVPVKYLTKKGAKTDGREKACLVTDGKERLYRCLKAEGFSLEGETPPAWLTGEEGDFADKENSKGNKSFQKRLEAKLLRRGGRRNTLLLLLGGGALAVAGILTAVLASVQVGAILITVGAYLLIQSAVFLVRRRTYLAVYDEGIYYRAETQFDSVFLKWEEIESIVSNEDGLHITCPVTAYRFPPQAAIYACCAERHPEKCGGERHENG